MGYQVGVTPLQMVTAVSAVANGGELHRAANRARGLSGRTSYSGQPEGRAAGGQHRHRRHADAIMEQVVERGTARDGADSRLHHRRKDRHREQTGRTVATRTDTYASFVGFVPSRNPAVAIIVVLDSPRGPNGITADRCRRQFSERIAEAALRYLGVAADDQSRTAGPRGPDQSDAGRRVTPCQQSPHAGGCAEPGRAENGAGRERAERARCDAQTRSSSACRRGMHGDGFVVAQDPAAGTPIERRLSAVWSSDTRQRVGAIRAGRRTP